MEYQTEIVDGHEVCYSSSWINDLEKEMHFIWYYHQAELVYANCNRNEKILEIGIGTGLLSDLLKKRSWNINTLDIDAGKAPDFCQSAVDFDYRKYGFQKVLAFEIFEHMPYETFGRVVEKIAASDVQAIYFSIPWNEVQLVALEIKLPRLRKLIARLALPRNRISNQAHFWELSRKDKSLGAKRLVTVRAIEKLFETNGYSLRKAKKVGYIQYFVASSI